MNFEDMLEETLNLKINIRLIQRNSKKWITLVENIEEIENIDVSKVNKVLKKLLCCNGSVKKENGLSILQFQGDQREPIKNFLMDTFELKDENIIVHG